MIKPLLIIALLLVAGFIGLRFTIQHLSRNHTAFGLSNGALQNCPDLPNCVTSVATRPAQQIGGLEVNIAGIDPLQVVVSLLDSMPEATVITRNKKYIHVTFKTKLLKFIDDVEFHFPADSATIDIRSASRLGSTDLGANRNRMEKLRSQLVGKL